jgi:hypothetical protein
MKQMLECLLVEMTDIREFVKANQKVVEFCLEKMVVNQENTI